MIQSAFRTAGLVVFILSYKSKLRKSSPKCFKAHCWYKIMVRKFQTIFLVLYRQYLPTLQLENYIYCSNCYIQRRTHKCSWQCINFTLALIFFKRDNGNFLLQFSILQDQFGFKFHFTRHLATADRHRSHYSGRI